MFYLSIPHGTAHARRVADRTRVRAKRTHETHHPSLACRLEHVSQVRPATFSKGMGGAEVPTAADHEGRWQGRSHRSSASVDGLITASVGIDSCELPEAGPTSVVEFLYRVGV